MPAAPVSPSHSPFPHTSLMSKRHLSSYSGPFHFKVCQPSVKIIQHCWSNSSSLCLSLWGFGHNYEGRANIPCPQNVASTKSLSWAPNQEWRQDQGRKVKLFASNTSVILQETGERLVKRMVPRNKGASVIEGGAESNSGEPNVAGASITQKHGQRGKKRQNTTILG